MTPDVRHSRRAQGWTALAAGLCALAAGLVLAVRSGEPVADAGMLPDPVATVRPTITPSGSSTPRVPARTAPVPAAVPAGWVPSRLDVAALRVDAPVEAVGVGAGHALEIPDDPERLGWWIGSATPGSDRGTVLVAGHVDTARDGAGAFFRLEKLPIGAPIRVRAGDRWFTYRAVARRSYDKRRLPADLFRGDTAPRLALVTCGGRFHHGTYSHNVVLYAEPVAPA